MWNGTNCEETQNLFRELVSCDGAVADSSPGTLLTKNGEDHVSNVRVAYSGLVIDMLWKYYLIINDSNFILFILNVDRFRESIPFQPCRTPL